MSFAKRQKKAQQKAAEIHTKKLIDTVQIFCRFLEKQPKPSDDEVREKFKDLNDRWVKYCIANKFNPRASLLFNQSVAHLWRTRYAIPNTTKNETKP